jgi:hypothetical protein
MAQWVSEVHYQNPETRTYVGSPSLLRLKDGSLLATLDYDGDRAPLNHEGEECLTSVYRSRDNGGSWQLLNHIVGAFWSNLFESEGRVYLLGNSAHDGHIVIRRSTDGGLTWTFPRDPESGLLFAAGPGRTPPNYHCAPVPMLVHQGRIYRAFEDNDETQVFASGFRSLVISAAEKTDLLRADSWRMSNRLAYDQQCDPPGFGAYPADYPHYLEGKNAPEPEGRHSEPGWLEGNVVADPRGQVWIVLRLNSFPVLNKAARIKVDGEGQSVSFDPNSGYLDFPGGASKFSIRREPGTGKYWTLVNDMEDGSQPIRRNRLSLYCSPDLDSWQRAAVLMRDDSEPDPVSSVLRTGFQYVDWQFDGDDIIYLTRTAYKGAPNFHDANRITFGRVRRYGTLCL